MLSTLEPHGPPTSILPEDPALLPTASASRVYGALRYLAKYVTKAIRKAKQEVEAMAYSLHV